MALQELGVASEIVTTAFALLFGAIALALGLSFGLGNRELAGEVTREWYNRYRAERDAIDRDNAQLDLQDEADAATYDEPRNPVAESGCSTPVGSFPVHICDGNSCFSVLSA